MGACFAQEREKRIKIAVGTCVSAVFFEGQSCYQHQFGPDCIRLHETCFFLTVLFTRLTDSCPYLRYNTVHLQHTLIQDANLMILDVVSPLGAVIGSTTGTKTPLSFHTLPLAAGS